MTPSQLKESSKASSSLIKTVNWIENFLAKPHGELGRSGLVCPFVPRSLTLEAIQMVEISVQNICQTELETVVKDYRSIFLEQLPQRGKLSVYKALLLVFSDLEDDQYALIERVQQRLKPFFVEKGLMLGEFHRFNQSPGLHNANFRPLQSPVPMLAIRFMMAADLPFLNRLTDSPSARASYLEAYLNHIDTVGDGSNLIEAKQALCEARQQMMAANVSAKCPVKQLKFAVKQFSAFLPIGR